MSRKASNSPTPEGISPQRGGRVPRANSKMIAERISAYMAAVESPSPRDAVAGDDTSLHSAGDESQYQSKTGEATYNSSRRSSSSSLSYVAGGVRRSRRVGVASRGEIGDEGGREGGRDGAQLGAVG